MKLGLIMGLLCCSSFTMASPTKGTFLSARELPSKQGVMYEIELKGGEYTAIDANGTNAGGDLDCILYQGADVVAEDKGHNVDSCHMKVGIQKTAKFMIVIVNNGPQTDRMTLTVQ